MGLSSFITYSLNYLKNNLMNINLKTSSEFLYPLVKFLLYLFGVITIFLMLNLLRILFVKKKHENNLIKDSMIGAISIQSPIDMIIYNTNLFDINFEVSIYNSTPNIYSKIDKFICTDCNGEIKFKKETLFGNFKYLCRVCEKELKYKYDYYTIRKRVEALIDSEFRKEVYSNFQKIE